MSGLTRLEKLTIELMSTQPLSSFQLDTNVRNTLLFGLPIGVHECETALAALVEYGIAEKEWSCGRKMYLHLCEKFDIAED